MNLGFVLPGVESLFNRVFGEELQERNKQREIKQDWETEGERVGGIHKMGSVTAVSNENESGKTWSAARHGGRPWRD